MCFGGLVILNYLMYEIYYNSGENTKGLLGSKQVDGLEIAYHRIR